MATDKTFGEARVRLAPTPSAVRDLAVHSGNRCAFPGCDHVIVNARGALVAELCHIEAPVPGGPRFNAAMSNEDCRDRRNLVFLCHRHHVETHDVDDWPTVRLRELKATHERRYAEGDTSFPESVITQITTPVAVTAAVYRDRLATTASRVGGLFGRDAELGVLLGLLELHRVVGIMGSGGVGKTRLVLAAADEIVDKRILFMDDRDELSATTFSAEIGSYDDFVLVVDNAHRRDDLRQLVRLLQRRGGPTSLVLVARDGYDAHLQDAVSDSSLGPLLREATVELRAMSNASIGDLVRAAKPRLEFKEAVEVIVARSEGNPLIALLAHGVVTGGGTLEQLGRDDVLARHAQSLVTSLHARSSEASKHEMSELLAIIAALTWLSIDTGPIVELVSKLLDVPMARLRRMLLDIADAGLLTQQGDRFAITPDLLSEHLLWSSFFSPRPAVGLPYVEVWRVLAPHASARLCRALGALPPDALRPEDDAGVLISSELTQLATKDAAGALSLINSIAPGAPWLAVLVVDQALQHLPQDPSRRSEALLDAADALQRTPTIDEGWPRQLAVAAAMWAAEPDEAAAEKMRAQLTSVYARVPVGRSPTDGETLVSVQYVLADATAAYWLRHANEPGVAQAVATASVGLLTVTFDNTTASVENERVITFHAYCLPASDATRAALLAGSKLFAATLGHLSPRAQRKQIQAVDQLRRTALGFDGPMGAPVSDDIAAIAADALEDLIARLRDSGPALSIVIRAAVDMAVSRVWNDDLRTFGPMWPDDAELREYQELLANGLHGPLDMWDENARTARTSDVADRLLGHDGGLPMLERWETWVAETAAVGSRDSIAHVVVEEALAVATERDSERVAPWLDEIHSRAWQLTPFTAAAFAQVLDTTAQGAERALRAASSAAPTVRACLATALRDTVLPDRLTLLARLATDTSAAVRSAVVNSIAFGEPFGSDELDAALLACAPDDLGWLGRLLGIRARRAANEPLLSALTQQQIAAAEAVVLATARRPRVREHDLQNTLTQLADASPRLALTYCRARIAYLASHDYRTDAGASMQIDGLPREIAERVRAAANSSDLTDTLDEVERAPRHTRVRRALQDLTSWLDDGGATLTTRLSQWLSSGDDVLKYEAARILNEHLLSPDIFKERARALAHVQPPLDIERAIVGAREPPSVERLTCPALDATARRIQGVGQRPGRAAGRARACGCSQVRLPAEPRRPSRLLTDAARALGTATEPSV